MDNTKIDWCDSTWNPITGCLHGCEYCYAKKQAKRFEGWAYTPGKARINVSEDKTYIHPMKAYYGEAKETQYGKIADIKAPFLKENGLKAPYPFGFMPTLHRYRLDQPQKWKTSRTIFVGSMADLFGKWVPDEWIEEVFAACEKAPQHRYLFLTKNPKRYTELANKGKLPQSKNIWYGTSITGPNMRYFCSFGTYNTFLSVEPLLKPLNAGVGSFSSTEWIIIGAETGNRKDKVKPKKEWIDNICEAAYLTRASVFMKKSLIPIVGEENMRREFPWK